MTEQSKKSWRKRFVLTGVTLLSLWALFYAEEDWRTMREWRAYEAELKTTGVDLNWRSYLPKPVPDAQNFAKTPLLEAIGYRGRSDTNLTGRLYAFLHGSSYLGDFTNGTRANLPGFVAAYAGKVGLAEDKTLPLGVAALGSLKMWESELSELREAASRPFAQFDAKGDDPWNLTLPDFVTLRQLSTLLSLHASACLEAGQFEIARQDIQAMSRLGDALSSHHTLVAAMINVAFQGGTVLQPFWEGWSARKWDREDYASFLAMFSRVDLLSQLKDSLNGGERSGVYHIVQNLTPREAALLFKPSIAQSAVTFGDRLAQAQATAVFALVPRGWWFKNFIVYDQIMRSDVEAIDVVNQRVNPGPLRVSNETVEAVVQRGGPFIYFTAMGVPNITRAAMICVRNQTMLNFARVVCALEMHRVESDKYPEKLADLSPKYLAKLPHDILTGEPLKYHPTDDGKFVLSASGWPQGAETGAKNVNASKADWSWPY